MGSGDNPSNKDSMMEEKTIDLEYQYQPATTSQIAFVFEFLPLNSDIKCQLTLFGAI